MLECDYEVKQIDGDYAHLRRVDLPDEGKYRTAWGYQGGLEFYPMADDNLHIFLTAIGKKYNLSERAKALDASLDDTARLSIGFIYRLPLY